MSGYAWLCDYTNFSIADTYNIVIQTKKFDGYQYFHLEKQKNIIGISLENSNILDYLNQVEDDFWHDWTNYNFIPNENMPIALFKRPDINGHRFPKSSEYFFRIVNNYLVINEKLHSIISQFNLGKTHFSQVYIYDIETKEQLSDTPYYFVNIAEIREFLNPNKSKRIKASSYTPDEPLRYIWDTQDDDIILSCADGELSVDLWSERYLHESLFFSDRLAQALFQAGLTQKELGLIRCLVN